MRQGLHEGIAERIERQLAEDPSYEIPSIAALAALHGVGTTTVWRAIRLLAAKGLVVSDGTLRIRRSDPGNTGDPPGMRSVDKLAGRIRQQIQNGTYNRGENLPKFDHFVEALSVSQLTIAHAFRQLADEHLIHKKGKRWIVGPRPADIPSEPSQHAREIGPTIVLLCTDTHQSVFQNPFLMSFIGSLESALREHDIRYTLAFRKREIHRSPFPHQGKQEVQHLIDSLGSFYRGAVIVDQFFDAESIPEWAHLLSRNKTRPVILFDASNTRRQFIRSGLGLGDWYFRMHFDEPAAVWLAMNHLVDQGHRTIGVPLLRNDWEWVRQRIALVKKTARRLHPVPSLIVSPLKESFWETTGMMDPTMSPETFSEQIVRFVQSQTAREKRPSIQAASSESDTIRQTPSMAALISQGATALVALNDWLAFQVYTWCYVAGVRIPGDMSIVSFDNAPITKMFPFSTVDFGFAQLGYRAAKILAGSAQAYADRNGNIPGMCTIVNHGSVTPPKAAVR